MFAAACVGVIGLVPVLVLPTNSDVAWLLFSAERVLDGATLYVDLIEVNPPLIVWLSLPPVAIAEFLDIRSRGPFLLYVLGLVLVSLRLSWEGLRQFASQDASTRRRTYLLLLVLVLLLLQGWAYGQREHLMVVLVTPYALTIAARLRGGRPSNVHLLAVGLLGGLGFALKPYYVPAWIALEFLYAWRVHRRTTSSGIRSAIADVVRRPEFLTALTVLLIYIAAVFALTPEYFEMGRRLAPVYLGVWETTPLELLMHPVTLMSLFALAVLALFDLEGPDGTVALVFGVLLAIWLVGAVTQLKGWWYHFYPALASASIVLALVVSARTSGEANRVSRLIPVIALVVLAGAVGGRLGEGVTALTGGADFDRKLPVTTDLVRKHLGKEGNLAVLSPHIHAAFPLVNRADVRWVLRFNSMWVPEIVYGEAIREDGAVRYHAPEEMSGPEHYFWESVLSDLDADPPEVLLLDRQRLRAPGFDYRDYFGRDVRFRRLMASCEQLGQVGRYVAHRCGVRPVPDAGHDVP